MFAFGDTLKKVSNYGSLTGTMLLRSDRIIYKVTYFLKGVPKVSPS